MSFTNEQLKALEKKLVSDLDSVRRVMALNDNPDLIRVSQLMDEINKPAAEQTLFEVPARTGPPAPPRPSSREVINNSEIAAVIMKFAAPFKFQDVVAGINQTHPNRILKDYSVPQVLRMLREQGKIKETAPREGRNGATYAKA